MIIVAHCDYVSLMFFLKLSTVYRFFRLLFTLLILSISSHLPLYTTSARSVPSRNLSVHILSLGVTLEELFSSVTQSCPTLCNPMDYSMPAFPVHHQLPEFTHTHVHWVVDAIQELYSFVFRAVYSSEQLHRSYSGLPIIVIHGISLLLSWIPEFCIWCLLLFPVSFTFLDILSGCFIRLKVWLPSNLENRHCLEISHRHHPGEPLVFPQVGLPLFCILSPLFSFRSLVLLSTAISRGSSWRWVNFSRPSMSGNDFV